MAAHAGVFFFDGRPTEAERRWIDASLQPMAPDRVSIVAKDGIVMGHAACHVWTGEAGASQPVRSESGLVMTWDGRLDNRDDLCLRLHGRLAGDVSDAEIAVQVFERWGIDGLRFLIGDWSLAIWNSRDRTLHLARDYMGVRPLYYYVDGHSVMWSSSLAELAIRAGRVQDLSESFVAQFMALSSSTEVTPYVGVRAVPTSTAVSISAEGLEGRRRYWSLEPGHVRYRDKRQYEEQLRGLWTEAVGARLRIDATVWAELSGGLDSSSIVCMADALVRSRGVAATGIQPLSHVTFESPEGDERRFIAEVEGKIGVRSDILGVEEHQDLRDPTWDWVTPRAAQGVQVASIQHVRSRAGRVILSGRMGDLVMGCAPDNSVAVLDDFAEARVGDALSKMRQWSRARRVPFIEIAIELMTMSVQARLGKPPSFAASQTQLAGAELLAEFLQPMLLCQAHARDRNPNGRPSQRSLRELVLLVSRQAQLEVQSGAFDVVYAYPYSHRPLVEFMLAIPGEELSAPGELRSLMRRAFVNLVPPRVLQRISKGYYPPAVMRATRPLAAALLPAERTAVVRRGWLDPHRLDAAIRTLVDAGAGRHSELQRVIRLEQWLTSRDRWGPTATPKGKEVTTNEVLIA